MQRSKVIECKYEGSHINFSPNKDMWCSTCYTGKSKPRHRRQTTDDCIQMTTNLQTSSTYKGIQLNFSSCTADRCPPTCRSAMIILKDLLGCCINTFEILITEIKTCGVTAPLPCMKKSKAVVTYQYNKLAMVIALCICNSIFSQLFMVKWTFILVSLNIILKITEFSYDYYMNNVLFNCNSKHK